MATNNNINAKTVGIQVYTGSAFTNVSLAGTANQISISNADGTGGNPTYSLTSTIYVSGISFDSGSNTLSTYSSGTFTPVLTATTAPTSVTYAANGQVGYYQRINQMVAINLFVSVTAVTGGSGSARIDSLPFTTVNATNALMSGPLFSSNVTITQRYLQTRANANSTFFNLQATNNGGTSAAVTLANFGTTGSCTAAMNYSI